MMMITVNTAVSSAAVPPHILIQLIELTSARLYTLEEVRKRQPFICKYDNIIQAALANDHYAVIM